MTRTESVSWGIANTGVPGDCHNNEPARAVGGLSTLDTTRVFHVEHGSVTQNS